MSKVRSHKPGERSTAARRQYTREFKEEAVRMVLDGHSVASVCQRLGLSSPTLLYRWRRQLIREGGAAAVGLEARVRELEAERPNLKYDLEVYLSNEPSTMTPMDSVLVRTAVEVMESRLGFPTRPFARGEGNASNDTNIFRRHGIPAIKCGPNVRTEANGAEMNRSHGLHVAKQDVVQATRFYLHMACELSGRRREEVNNKP